MRKPQARLIRNPRDAEIAARDWMQYFGFSDATLTAIGPDEGVDVISGDAIAQVKSGETTTGRPVIQQIYGVASYQSKKPLVFSVAPVTKDAREWANKAGVGLFRLDLSGAAFPVNNLAKQIFKNATGRLAGWQAVRAELETLKAERRQAVIFGRFPAPEGFRGFWSIRHSGDGKISMSRDIVGSGEVMVDSVDHAVNRLQKLLTEMGLGYSDCQVVIEVEGQQRPFNPRLNYPSIETFEEPGFTKVSISNLPIEVPLTAINQPREKESKRSKIQKISMETRPESSASLKTVRITASDIYQMTSRKHCDRAFYFRSHNIVGDSPSQLQEMLQGLGMEAEKAHFNEFQQILDLSDGPLDERAEHTIRAVNAGTTAIYQGVLKTHYEIDGTFCEVIGVPDFMVFKPEGTAIRDVKISTSIAAKKRKDILAQLQFYGWLFERVFNRSPAAIQIKTGNGKLLNLKGNIDRSQIEDSLRRIFRAKTAPTEPYCPTKLSRSGDCPYFSRCWEQALANEDPCTIPGVSSALAKWFRNNQIANIADVTQKISGSELAEVQLPYGKTKRRVGQKRAQAILRSCASIKSGQIINHGKLDLPLTPHFAILDLEATPSVGKQQGLVYLWGTCVKGPNPMDFHAAFLTGDLTDESTGWFRFLDQAKKIFERYGDSIPFLHWSPFEKTHLKRCINAYGDPLGIGQHVIDNLLDLHRIVKSSMTLPVYSYSLKEIEKYVGFVRSQDQFGGDWSIAVWNDAMKAGSIDDRLMLLNELAIYNKEDLEGLWAVYQWLVRRE